ncbi:MAG: DUF1501 domain-containing protein, partial [Planctomycetota bacterium]|nr:DUF1501 domain-containing protein [Planctomycetota bacterium]
MLNILDRAENQTASSASRREWLKVGGLGLGGLSIPNLLANRSIAAPAADSTTSRAFGKAKSVIVIFLGGGPPQHESWDPKPEAPAEIRGGFGTNSTNTPGLSIGELMPMTARHTDKIAVLRAMVTNDNAHSSSGYQMMTGVPHVPLSMENAVSKAPNLSPHWGSVTKYLKQQQGQSFPAAITLPTRIANVGEVVWPGQIGGVLGSKYDPWLLTCDPSQPTFKVPDLALPPELTDVRFSDRLSLLQQVNQHLDRVSESPAVAGFNRQTQQALDLLSGSKARQAFDLSQESPATRDRYGRTRWAQSVLLARRLVEAGVSLVHINWVQVDGEPNAGSWDTHNNHNDLLKRFLMPWMDQAYSALLTDLFERGLLEETLVLWVGEFGHTPRFNPQAGRDHWGSCF